MAYLRYAEVEEIFAQALEEQDPAQFRRAAAGFAEIARDYPGTESEIGALSNMGVCHESLGQWKDAVQAYDQVLERLADEQAEAHRFAACTKSGSKPTAYRNTMAAQIDAKRFATPTDSLRLGGITAPTARSALSGASGGYCFVGHTRNLPSY